MFFFGGFEAPFKMRYRFLDFYLGTCAYGAVFFFLNHDDTWKKGGSTSTDTIMIDVPETGKKRNYFYAIFYRTLCSGRHKKNRGSTAEKKGRKNC